MPLNETSGNLTTDAFGGGVAVVPNYIEEVFSTYIYDGTGGGGTDLVAVNNIDLATKGGMTWLKCRTGGSYEHKIADTVRGYTYSAVKIIESSTTNAETSISSYWKANTNGFTIAGGGGAYNQSGNTYASWTFRKQPKFFDVVTYTGNYPSTQSISHSLGSTPGMIICKAISADENWRVYHRSLGVNKMLTLNTTGGETDITGLGWSVSSTAFSPSGYVNNAGVQYVAYLFAHNAGGFGLTGTDNVISCGSFTTATSVLTVTLGYEPQYILYKRTDASGDWQCYDNMRGFPNGRRLVPNSSAAEDAGSVIGALATGFTVNTTYNASFIYIAIRRGPMKVPTDATKVFAPVYSTASTGAALTTNFPVDMQFEGYPPGDSLNMSINDRLRGVSTTATQSTLILTTSSTAAEASPNATMTNFWDNTGFKMPGYYGGIGYISWNFRRAPSFFDEVCYTGTGSATTVSHNLQAVPELVINKNRDGTFGWYTCFNFTSTTYDQNTLSTTNAANIAVTYGTGGDFFSAKPTTTGLPLSAGANNLSAKTYVSYLFATCSGVSKVGSYTGNGTTQTINCGFTGGARFVLIKRTDSTGDWYVYDTARGMTTLTDPYLLLNSTAAESATLGSVTTTTGGFTVNASILSAINTNAASYIFLAIA